MTAQEIRNNEEINLMRFVYIFSLKPFLGNSKWFYGNL